MTAYLNVPLEYPLLIARKACKNERPSRPCEMAKAHSEGEETSDHEISLHGYKQPQPISNRMIIFTPRSVLGVLNGDEEEGLKLTTS